MSTLRDGLWWRWFWQLTRSQPLHCSKTQSPGLALFCQDGQAERSPCPEHSPKAWKRCRTTLPQPVWKLKQGRPESSNSRRAISSNFHWAPGEAASTKPSPTQRAGSALVQARYWSASPGRPRGIPLTLMPKARLFVAVKFNTNLCTPPPNAHSGVGNQRLTPLGHRQPCHSNPKRPSRAVPGRVFFAMVLGPQRAWFWRFPCLALLAGDEVVGPITAQHPVALGSIPIKPARCLVQNERSQHPRWMLTLRSAEGRNHDHPGNRVTPYINSDRFGPLKANALYAYGGDRAVKQEPFRSYCPTMATTDHQSWEPSPHGRRLGGVAKVDVPNDVLVRQQPGPLHRSPPDTKRIKGRESGGLSALAHDRNTWRHRPYRSPETCLAALFSKITVRRIWFRLPSLPRAAG